MVIRLQVRSICHYIVVFFFNDTATTEIYTLSLHDALPILSRWAPSRMERSPRPGMRASRLPHSAPAASAASSSRSEEHTSELQSRQYLVCRLLLEKKNTLSNKSAMTSYSY